MDNYFRYTKDTLKGQFWESSLIALDGKFWEINIHSKKSSFDTIKKNIKVISENRFNSLLIKNKGFLIESGIINRKELDEIIKGVS